MNTNLVLSNNIRKIIDRKGFKQKAIADKCKINDKAFSNMLCGRQEIRTEHIPLIADALEVPIGVLFETTE